MIDGKYFGIYRGYVVNNDDSQTENPYLGRLQVSVPEVYGEPQDVESLPWAWPCVGAFGGGVYDSTKQKVDLDAQESDTKFSSGIVALPPIGATVWLMFEQGDPQVPVWMGTWIGKASELPSAAKASGSTVYPQIFLLKMPWGKNMYIRGVGNKVFELCFDDMHVQLNAETSQGAGDQNIDIWSDTADIKLRSIQGNIAIQGKEVTIDSENDMKIRCGRYKKDPLTGETVVDTIGDLQMWATQDGKIHIERFGVISTGKDGQLHGQSPTVSGFDKHDTINDQELQAE